jgi:peptidoglycan/LPS O-acetylase OafA/YrhL
VGIGMTMTGIPEQAPASASPARTPTAPNPADRSRRIEAVDGARGAAILLVMLLHFSMYGHHLRPSGLFIDSLYYRVTEAAGVGVDLFLVVSGFLITGILYDTKQSKRYFRNFYARRVLRIFPLYYCALLLFLVVLPRLRPDNWGLQMLTRDAPWYWTYLVNVKIALAGWPAFGALGHFWSLAMQEQFYLVWPIVVLAFNRRQLQFACIACIIGALVLRVLLSVQGHTTAAFVLTPARIDAMAVGAYIAIAARGPGGLQTLARLAKVFAPLLSLALLVIFVVRKGFVGYDPFVLTVGHSLVALFFGAILVLALTSTRNSVIVRLFESRVLRFFGKYSYGMYVFHHPMLFFKPGILPLSIVPTIYGSQLPRQFVYLVVATGVSVVLAMASWHFVEQPFLNLKKLFPYLRSRANADSPTLPSEIAVMARSDASVSAPLQGQLTAGAQSSL